MVELIVPSARSSLAAVVSRPSRLATVEEDYVPTYTRKETEGERTVQFSQ